MTDQLKAPFPWFGGKSRATELIWERLGAIDNYVEPFAGSLAVLLGAPTVARFETVNDKDGFIANFWRALQSAPDDVAEYADGPVNETDLTARHTWLVQRRTELTERLEADPEYFDAKVAGWWCWGICCWIAGGWCSGKGPWVPSADGQKLVHRKGSEPGVKRQLVHMGWGQGVHRQHDGLRTWFAALADRLRRVRVGCGDWSRVCGPASTTCLGLTGVVLDPPYSEGERDMNVYATDSGTVAAECRAWALEHGNDPNLRIVLCGYDTEHDMPGWHVVRWTGHGGHSRRSASNLNRYRETLWFSPHCLNARQPSLFDSCAGV